MTGHLERMPAHRAVKRTCMGRPVGRPKVRRGDEVEKNFRALHARNWENKTGRAGGNSEVNKNVKGQLGGQNPLRVTE